MYFHLTSEGLNPSLAVFSWLGPTSPPGAIHPLSPGPLQSGTLGTVTAGAGMGVGVGQGGRGRMGGGAGFGEGVTRAREEGLNTFKKPVTAVLYSSTAESAGSRRGARR